MLKQLICWIKTRHSNTEAFDGILANSRGDMGKIDIRKCMGCKKVTYLNMWVRKNYYDFR